MYVVVCMQSRTCTYISRVKFNCTCFAVCYYVGSRMFVDFINWDNISTGSQLTHVILPQLIALSGHVETRSLLLI